MNKYAALDAAMLRHIAAGKRTFPELWCGCSALAKKVRPESDTWRVIDARLQAMRKAKKIAFNSKTGWAIASKEAA